MERAVAALLTSALGVKVARNILSGANNVRDDGSRRPGDSTCPAGYDFLTESKYRASFMHHGLYHAAVADAKKHGINPKTVTLWTKVKRETGMLVTMSDEFYCALLLAGGSKLLKKEESVS
jgi:hypothetical protein